MLETLIGGMAAAIGVSISLPQIWKTYHTKKASDISLSMWLLLIAGQVLWLTYGILRGDIVLILANSIGFIQTATMLAMIHKYRH